MICTGCLAMYEHSRTHDRVVALGAVGTEPEA